MSGAVSPAEAIFLALADLTQADRETMLRERCGSCRSGL